MQQIFQYTGAPAYLRGQDNQECRTYRPRVKFCLCVELSCARVEAGVPVNAALHLMIDIHEGRKLVSSWMKPQVRPSRM